MPSVKSAKSADKKKRNKPAKAGATRPGNWKQAAHTEATDRRAAGTRGVKGKGKPGKQPRRSEWPHMWQRTLAAHWQAAQRRLPQVMTGASDCITKDYAAAAIAELRKVPAAIAPEQKCTLIVSALKCLCLDNNNTAWTVLCAGATNSSAYSLDYAARGILEVGLAELEKKN